MHVRRRRGQAGFTLIELVIATTILGVITIPLANLLIGYFTNVTTTTSRLAESYDEQFAAAYWHKDVAAIGVRSSTFDLTSQTFPLQQSVDTAFPCGVPNDGARVVVLAWDRYDAAGKPTLVRVAYALDTTGTQLLRLQCDGSTPGPVRTLAHDLDPARPPAVVCRDAAGRQVACTGVGDAVPSTVSLTLHVKDPSDAGQPYTVTLTGQRRQT
jgi:prepilin-type N-terminal cleavage/methylation domain-containing protein